MGSGEVPVLELHIHTEVVNQASQGPQLVAYLVGHRIHTQVIVLTFAVAAVRIHTQVTSPASTVAVRILAWATYQVEASRIRPCHLEAYHQEAFHQEVHQLEVNHLRLK